MRAKAMTDSDWQALRTEITETFSPSAPVEERDLFSGRSQQLETLLDAVNQRGKHAIVFGERGVGKTSLANILKLAAHRPTRQTAYVRVNADPTDTFESLWRKVFKRMSYAAEADGVPSVKVSDELTGRLAPDDVQLVLEDFSAHQTPIIVLDEFDRIQNRETTQLVADTIKALSDYSVNATVIVVGVAEDVSTLMEGHESIARCLVQIRMPRMSNEEMQQLILTRYNRCGLRTDHDTTWKIGFLSRGLPPYTHLLAMNAALYAIASKRIGVTHEDVDGSLARSVSDVTQSIREQYSTAIRTQKKDTLYPYVLLACALAKTDEMGRFQQTDVVQPLNQILPGKAYTAATFALHMNEFTEISRGEVLKRTGTPRNYRYRFADPMMQPFVVFKGLAEGILSDKSAEIFSAKPQSELFSNEPLRQ